MLFILKSRCLPSYYLERTEKQDIDNSLYKIIFCHVLCLVLKFNICLKFFFVRT